MIQYADRPEKRYKVDFPAFVSIQQPAGLVQRLACRCVNLSPSGAQIETKDPLPARATVLLHSAQFGRMGLASVRFCRRCGMKYSVGLQFSFSLELSDPERKKILETVMRRDPARG